MSPPALEMENVGVALRGRMALDGVSLRAAPGALIALLGPNGAGKTTLLRAALGLTPSTGRIRLGGADLAALSAREKARRAAFLPQGGALHWPLSARDVVALGRLPHAGRGGLSGADRAAVERAMARCGVGAFAERPATELSGGERARVLLARALAVEAPLLLVDEPVASLDPAFQLAVMETLREEARAGRAVVAVLHDLGLAARFADEIAALGAGRLAASGPPAALLSDGSLARLYGVGLARAEADGALLVAPVAPSPGGETL